MWTLHDGQMVEVAAEVSSCVVPKSKQATDVVRVRFHIRPTRRSNEVVPAGSSLSTVVVAGGGFPGRVPFPWPGTASPATTLGLASTGSALTTKCLPHCRQNVLLA